jgi:thiol-disulfide isomerase/thioredoxin
MFRSSWCSACRILEPRVDDVRAEMPDAPIDWIRFNFTWGERDGLRDLAVAEGIAPLYDQFAGSTGFLVLMDRDSGQVFEIITMRYGREEIREALERWQIVVERLESVEG